MTVASIRRVVLIGPESTGKTQLAERLAARFRAPWSAEYARRFVEQHPRDVVYADVEAIADGQRDFEDDVMARAREAGAPLVIHDTDLVSTMVYSRHYYGDCPAWIPEAAAARLADVYLLHQVDVPWVEEAFCRVEPERRTELFELFRATLAALGAHVVTISGDWDARYDQAVRAIDALLVRAV